MAEFVPYSFIYANYTNGYSISNYPKVNIFNKVNTFEIFLDIPGVSSDSIDIDFYNDAVIITAERTPPNNENNEDNIFRDNYYEILYGFFEREIRLPFTILNQNSVSTNLDNGVLSIIIDKQMNSF